MEPQLFQPQTGTGSVESDKLAVSLSLPAVSDAASVASQLQTQPPPVGAIEKFADVLPEFMFLSERASASNLFTEPEWLEAYVKAFEPSSEVLALTARQNGRLTGILPVIRTVERWHGFPVRVLRPPANSHCHSFEVPREDGASGRDALRAIFCMLDSLEDWDVMELPRLFAPGNTLSELFSLAQERNWYAARGASLNNVFVQLKPGVGKKIDAPWLSDVAARQRKDLRRAERLVKANVDGWICFETIEHPTPEQLRLFFELECSGWKGAQNSAIMSNRATKTFYSEIARTYAASGRFMLNFLFLQDQPAAGQMGIRTGDSFWGLKLAYDQRFSRYSPGSLLINAMLRLCWERGFRKLELGPESPYKRRWTDQGNQLTSFYLFRPGFYGRLLYDYKFLARPRLKQALTHLRLSPGSNKPS